MVCCDWCECVMRVLGTIIKLYSYLVVCSSRSIAGMIDPYPVSVIFKTTLVTYSLRIHLRCCLLSNILA